MNPEHWSDGVEDESWLRVHSPWEALPGVRTGSELTRGERLADLVRNRMGSWGFVAAFTGFMAAWAVVNTVVLARHGFDPYPYILLNLMLSTLAGLQGAILLIAAKRADAVAAEQALSHLTISRASREIIGRLEEELRRTAENGAEIRRLVAELHDAAKRGGGT